MTPSLWLALLFVLIGAQVARLVTARVRVHYVVLLLAACAGFVLGELAAHALHAGGPSVGALHPAADAVGMGVCELVVITFTAHRRHVP